MPPSLGYLEKVYELTGFGDWLMPLHMSVTLNRYCFSKAYTHTQTLITTTSNPNHVWNHISPPHSRPRRPMHRPAHSRPRRPMHRPTPPRPRHAMHRPTHSRPRHAMHRPAHLIPARPPPTEENKKKFIKKNKKKQPSPAFRTSQAKLSQASDEANALFPA